MQACALITRMFSLNTVQHSYLFLSECYPGSKVNLPDFIHRLKIDRILMTPGPEHREAPSFCGDLETGRKPQPADKSLNKTGGLIQVAGHYAYKGPKATTVFLPYVIVHCIVRMVYF